ncbi:MAG: TMEM175 family protein [Enterococcus sp.]
MSKTRLEAFTDAVIAIIMTLLVLELHAPTEATWSALGEMGHKFIIYIISFATLAIYWNNHHHLFQLVHKIDGRVLWANNLFILSLSLFPLVTAWVGDFLDSWPAQATYGIVILLANTTYYLLARHLLTIHGKDSKLGIAFRDFRKSYVSMGLMLIGLLFGWLVNPVLVLGANIIILLMWIIPERKIEKQYK